MPRLAGNFLAGLHSLFIGQNCRFEQRFTREFHAYKTRDELHFTSVLSFLAVQNVSILLMQFRIGIARGNQASIGWSMYSALSAELASPTRLRGLGTRRLCRN